MAIAPSKTLIAQSKATSSSRLSSIFPLPSSSSWISFRSRQGSRSSQTLRISASAASSPVKVQDPKVKAAASDAKPTVLVAEKLGEAGLAVLRSFANVDCSYNLSREDLHAKISLCDAIIVRSGTKVTREVFEAAKGRLKVVGRAGVGIDNVDLQAATEYGCLVVNAPTANTVAAAEHGIALMAAMARNVAQADASMKAGEITALFSFNCIGFV